MDAITILKKFAEGTLTDQELERQLQENPQMEACLCNPSLDWHNTYLQHTTPYLYLAEMNIQTLTGRYEAQAMIQLFLEKSGIKSVDYKKYREDYELISRAQPKYVDAPPAFIEKHILLKESEHSKTAQQQLAKERFAALFRFHGKPPKWIQNPAWPIINEKPLFYLGALPIKNCDLFHDDGCIYIFTDPDTGLMTTIQQWY